MKQGAGKSTSRRSPPVLRIASSPRDAWKEIVRPWFDAAPPTSWKDLLPSIVVVPTRSLAQALKARLLLERRSHLGLRFATAAMLREMMASEAYRTSAAREHLRLLLAISAEEALRSKRNNRDLPELDVAALAAKAVVRTPDHLLHTLERLEIAGWDFERLGMPAFDPIIHRFRQHLGVAGFGLYGEVDRATFARAAQDPPRFANLLLTGFDSSHWAYWFLLRAAVAAAENATIALEYPRSDGGLETSWIGSWEEAYGEAVPVASTAAGPNELLFSETEMRGASRLAPRFTFLVGTNACEQAKAIAVQCLRFLSEEKCTRLGIVFAQAGALSRLVASALARLEIPHNDGIGHPVPGLFESAEWRAWLELQRGPRINSLVRFISALPARDALFPGLRLHAFERILRDAHKQVLIDDLEILREFCATEAGGSKKLVAEALRSLHFLPARARLADFLELTHAAFNRLGWTQHSIEMANRSGDWMASIAVEFSRTLYLRWLEETASTFGAARTPAGDHPYARVQLLTVPQAHGQEWSHLIFAGWNEGSWPPPASGEFAREEEIQAFNRGIQQLNQRAARQGWQGEGHMSVRENHCLYLGPVEQRQIALRQFDALLESASEGIAFTASLVQENAPERLWNPSELFTRFYQQTHRQPLTHAAMSSLQRATDSWLSDALRLTSTAELPSVTIAQTRVAYDARRDPLSPAGEYDFAFRAQPARIPILSVSEMEKLVSTPALIWMKTYLGVEAPEDDGSPWSAATGQWVHHWLADVGGAEGNKTFVRLPAASELDQRIRSAAEKKSSEVKRLCLSASKPLPDWWRSGWQNALCLARHLGSKIATTTEWPWMASEWKIDAREPVSVGNRVTLSFRGRIDLLLARREPPAESLQTEEVWILDYKTGSNKALVPAREDVEKRKTALHNRLVKGEALQLGLYALAVRQAGARDVFLSLVSPVVKIVAPQLSVGDIAAHEEIFEALALMLQGGVFGMYGALRPAFGYARDYPLATLGIDLDLLEDKWEFTHPALVREEEEWDY